MKYMELHEDKQHGSAGFPIENYYVTSAHPQYEMPLHWHNEFEMIHIISGSFRLFLNHIEYQLNQGDIILVSSGALHRGEPYGCIYECLVFDPNMLWKPNDIIMPYILPIINGSRIASGLLHTDDGMLYVTVLSLFTAVRRQAPYYELEVYSLLFSLFAQLYDGNFIKPDCTNKRSDKQTDKILLLLGWMEQHYAETVTLTELSKIAGFNQKYLCRLFKEFTDRTPIDYVNNLRIEHACSKLASGDRNVTDVAFECGFNNLSYFSKTFKKYKKLTPKEYADKYNR